MQLRPRRYVPFIPRPLLSELPFSARFGGWSVIAVGAHV